MTQFRLFSVRRTYPSLARSERDIACVTQRDNGLPSQLLEEVGLLNPTLVAGHCIHLDEREIARIGAAGVYNAHSPYGNAVSGHSARYRPGSSRRNYHAVYQHQVGRHVRSDAHGSGRPRGGYQMNAEMVFGWATRNGAAAHGLSR